MLLPNNSNPKKCIYYVGGHILALLKGKDAFDYLDLYTEIRKKIDISIQIYTLTLDWLFLISVAVMDEKDGVIKCI
ncbi:ABC-three component system middle component 6 [Thomasclavelia sp.]